MIFRVVKKFCFIFFLNLTFSISYKQLVEAGIALTFYWKYLFWNELTFLVTYDVIMNVSSEAAIRRCSSKEVFLTILQYSQEDACVGVSLNIFAGVKACNFIKKKLQHRCFLVSIAKFLRTAFLYNTSDGGCCCWWFHYRNIKTNVFL